MHKNFELNEENLAIYGDDNKVFLQRCRYYYMYNQELCVNLEIHLLNNLTYIFLFDLTYQLDFLNIHFEVDLSILYKISDTPCILVILDLHNIF